MKLYIISAISFAFMSVACGDTLFSWFGADLLDETGTPVPQNGPTPVNYDAITYLNTDLSPFVDNINNTIDISNIPAVFFTIQDMFVANDGPPSFNKEYTSNSFLDNGGSGIGDTAYLVVKKGSGSIQVGDWIGLGGNAVITDQGSPPSAPGQQIDGGIVTTNIQVIPEPSTFFLIGIAGLGLYVTRRFARK
jgi:hypothetical protein